MAAASIPRADMTPSRSCFASHVALLCLLVVVLPLSAQNRVFYAGGPGRDAFRDVHALSDGSLLVAGQASSLDWIAASVPRTVLPTAGLDSVSSGSIGFLLHVDRDLLTVRRVVHWPAGSARDVFKIRSTEVPGQPTGDLYISGSRDGAAVDGYYLAKLVGNGVSAPISGVAFVYNVRASGGPKDRQPWDVGGDGAVVHATGREFNTEWATVEKIDRQGRSMLVEHWHAHWSASGEWNGTPASSYSGASPLLYSALVMKAGRRGSLRSITAADHEQLQSDGNGNAGRRGRFPDDYYYAGPCAMVGSGTCPSTGPGYTGYRAANAQTQRVGAIAIDRRDNTLYFGYGTKSVLPGGNPDFEPAIVAMAANGRLLWWDRLYQETSQNSSPDQYIDGVAVDYGRNRLVVMARSHGNNTINLWRGNGIALKPGGSGFQNQFTGTNGNIHISWLGSYGLASGRIHASTYVAEYVEGSTNYGAPLADPIFGGWPNPNAGWPDVNTTRCGADAGFSGEIAVGPGGEVAVLCQGRRTLTTTDALQQMPRPNAAPRDAGTWNDFVRVYSADLSTVLYSTLITGQWDRSTGAGGDNTDLVGVDFGSDGLRVVGRHLADSSNVARGEPVPTASAPAWGGTRPQGESALIGWLRGNRVGSASAPPVGGPQWLAELPVVSGTTDRGHRDLLVAGLPAANGLYFEAFGPVAPARGDGSATADPTPDDPFNADSGTGTFLVFLNAAAQPRRWRVLVEVESQASGRVDVFVGTQDDGDNVPEAGELRCAARGAAALKRCDLEFTQAAGQTGRYWVVVQSRAGRVDYRLDAYAVPIDAPNSSISLAATSPARSDAGAGLPLRLVWNEPALLSGERRGGWLRAMDGSTALGWVPVRLDRTGTTAPVAQALPPAADYALALPAGGVHERLFVDVPPGATELRVAAASARPMTVHLARRPLPAADAGIPTVAVAPVRSEAAMQATIQGGRAELVLPNPQAGRWYVTPTNPTESAAPITLRATVSANAPTLRPGGYFNPQRSGHGLFVYPAGSQWAAIWYTYLQDRSPTWYYLQAEAPRSNGQWRAVIYRSSWNGSSNRLTAVGEAQLALTAANGFVFSYTLDGETGSESFTDFGGGCPNVGGSRIDASGHWFDPVRSGSGYSVQLFPDYEFFAAFVYDGRGVPRYLAAERASIGGAASTLDLQQLTGFCPLCARSSDPTRTTVGRLQRTLGAGSLQRVALDVTFAGDVSGRWSAVDAVQPLGGLQGCRP